MDLYAQLLELCHADHVTNDVERMAEYGRDATEDLQFHPVAVVKPDSAEKVAEILKFCNAHKIKVYTRGAGTGLSGGALPVHEGIVISTENLNRILHVDTENFQATVEPGVINDNFRESVEAYGLFYPPDPASKGTCTLGGNVAHSSGGPKCVKYGTTKDYVLNLQVALPDGRLIWTGANTVKNSTGFNLTQLMVGSEGMLGIVTKIVFRLLPLPRYNVLMLAPFASAADAGACVNHIMLSGVLPSALELMEAEGAMLSSKATQTAFPFAEGATFYMLVELDGNDPELLDKEAEFIYPILEANGAMDVLLADSSEAKEKWWKVRRSIGETVKSKSIYKEEDTVVPRAALPKVLVAVKEIGLKYGFESICYGHAGDGNLHINILKNDLSDAQWNEEVPKGIREIFTLCKELGGTISGEHGVGYVQKEYLDIVFEPVHFELMRGIKNVFDPNSIMNPGKWL